MSNEEKEIVLKLYPESRRIQTSAVVVQEDKLIHRNLYVDSLTIDSNFHCSYETLQRKHKS